MVNIYRVSIVIDEWMFKIILGIKFNIHVPESLDPHRWYFLVCNHQTWADSLLLQTTFHHSAPVLKFLVKKQLKFVPLIGLICWAYDYPFLQRYTRRAIEKNPDLRERDLQRLRDACAKFAISPAAIMNYAEGTRFKRSKWEQQGKPYQYLLKPKAGGATVILDVMRHKLQSILDVTVVYSTENPSLWDFLCGKIPEVTVVVEEIPIKEVLPGPNTTHQFQHYVEQWMNQLWARKDQKIAQMKNEQYLSISKSAVPQRNLRESQL